MKIKKVDERPMKLHTKGAFRLRIKKASKPRVKKIRVSGGMKGAGPSQKTVKKDSNASIVIKGRRLYTMGRIGAKKAADQMEGGEEIKESAEVMSVALSPVFTGADQARQIFKRRRQKKLSETRLRSKTGVDKRKGRDFKEHLKASDIKKRKQSVKAKDKGTSHKHSGRKYPGKSVRKADSHGGSAVKMRMLEAFLSGRRKEDESQQTVIQSMKESAKSAALMLIKRVATALLPGFLGVFSVIALVGIVVVAVLGVIYNSPLSIFVPLPDTGYENPRTVLSSYYMEFNQKVLEIEENGDEISYQNTKNGAPISNFNDTLMVYMILYSDGTTGFVMDDAGKANLKKVFDEMNYIDSESSETEVEVGDSIGKVWATAYCPCSICCGPYANGITASGKTARAKHTIAVDAYNPIVPMGTKVVIEGITYTVEDTGDLNHYGNDFDIFYAHHEDCGQWGRKHVEAYLAEGNTNKVMVKNSGTTVHNLTYDDYIGKGTLTAEQEKMLSDMMDSELWDTYYSSASGQAVAELAYTKLGCRYDQDRRWEEGYYDCSSLVYRLYKEVGIDLPAIAADQGKYCYENAMLINKEDLKPGDLIFYSYEDNGAFRNISHVAIYVGEGKIIHAANKRRGVVCDPIRDGSVVFYARPYK